MTQRYKMPEKQSSESKTLLRGRSKWGHWVAEDNIFLAGGKLGEADSRLVEVAQIMKEMRAIKIKQSEKGASSWEHMVIKAEGQPALSGRWSYCSWMDMPLTHTCIKSFRATAWQISLFPAETSVLLSLKDRNTLLFPISLKLSASKVTVCSLTYPFASYSTDDANA